MENGGGWHGEMCARRLCCVAACDEICWVGGAEGQGVICGVEDETCDFCTC